VSTPAFPTLTRKPALRTKTTTLDPTLRDPMENGMSSSRARYTRRRRKWSVTIDMLTLADQTALEDFVVNTAVFGAVLFTFLDTRNTASPETLTVRFEVLPSYTDCGFVSGEFRQNASFEIGEV
jgi:hypothetical protein